jgi:hypothetical protein
MMDGLALAVGLSSGFVLGMMLVSIKKDNVEVHGVQGPDLSDRGCDML